ncbi:hypothetical protein [Mycobacterium sp. E1386]|uniref:hypothetical protein n=1 Tax=Mycobacterium sp. E1386 TaxID=1834126 RepID=UPI000B19A2A0|nr:hypothetical protein [Mycobacterium sp. E1386]
MTDPQVWVSTTLSEIKFDGAGPGGDWELVGEINTRQETEFYKHIQVLLSVRRSAPRTAEFYLSGDPDSQWVQATDRPPFWVAIDPYGTMRPHIHNARPTYFVSNAQATVTPLARRPPGRHPAAPKSVMVPIRLKRADTGFFTPWRQPRS